MHSFELISHPELEFLIMKFKNKFPKIDLESNMLGLGWHGYIGMGLDVMEVKKILKKCIDENKYFKVWSISWKGPEPMPHDWWKGKVVYYNYK